MAIGERIHFFRLLRGMTQKYLGMALGFPEKSADVRLAQYETGSRTPKADLTAALAQVLDVSPHALSVPDIDSYVGLMHTLFTLEDNYGLKITEQDGELALQVDFRKNKDAARLHEMLWAWREQASQAGGRRDLPGGLRPLALPLPGVRQQPDLRQGAAGGSDLTLSLVGHGRGRLLRKIRKFR